MEITCQSCLTEYDFDDALVSERGTTVRCTNCGELFKIFRSEPGLPEEWTVRRRDGRELVFTTLRDLQRAISGLQVTRQDELIRGIGPARPLGSIAELDPFFVGRFTSKSGRPGSNPSPAQPSKPASEPPLPLNDRRMSADSRPEMVVPKRTPTLRPSSLPSRTPENLPVEARDASPTATPRPMPPAPEGAPEDSDSGRSGVAAPDRDGVPNEGRISRYVDDDDWFGEPRFSGTLPPRSRALRWGVALLILGLLGVAALAVGRKYGGTLAEYLGPRSTAVSSQHTNQSRTWLDEGERALAEGDLESAKENFDKASVVSEGDARALLDLARLSAVRADVDWLKTRLLPPEQSLLVAAAKRQLIDSAGRAQRAAERAAAAAPEDAHAALVRIDALRITGDLAGARSLVERTGAISQQPETAYVLAALDLDEPSPNYATVIDRLEMAASAEGNLMRARSALVYALVRAGRSAQAKVELDRVAACSRPHPLLAELGAFAARAGGLLVGTSATTENDAGKRTSADVHGSDPTARGGEDLSSKDFRTLLLQAERALAARQYARAEELFRAALAAHPGDTEAATGLGDCARVRGQLERARASYRQVLADNPNYLPALGSLADMQWESGSRKEAGDLYRRIVELSPASAQANRAKVRLDELDRPKQPLEPTGPTGSEATPMRVNRDGMRPPVGVDTSDLPGFGQ